MVQQTTLSQLYHEHQGKLSDKWSLYLDELDRIIEPYRDQRIRLFEIGVQNGGSLEIWGRYFANAEIILGCDNDPKIRSLTYTDPRIRVVVGDANSDECETEILHQATSLDVIIDDGSHVSGDIIKSFARYFPHLNEHGLYIVEDLHSSYWANFGGGLHAPLSAMAFFKRLADVLNHEHWRINKARTSIIKGFAKSLGIQFDELDLARIHSIEFLNSLCVIKKSSPDKNTLGRRFISGLDESVTSRIKKYSGTSIQDINATIKDDGELDVFELMDSLQVARKELVNEKQQAQGLIAEREKQSQALKAQLSEQEKQARTNRTKLVEREQRLKSIEMELNGRDLQIHDLHEQIKKLQEQTSNLSNDKKRTEQELRNLKSHIDQREQILQDLNSKLLEIYSSTAWKLIVTMWRVRLALFPPKSIREQLGRKLFSFIRSPKKVLHELIRKTDKSEFSQKNKDNPDLFKVTTPLSTSAVCEYYEPAARMPVFEAWQLFNQPNKLKTQVLMEVSSKIKCVIKFSVIMPVYDPPIDILNKAIESVLDQFYHELELILVDDCSSNPAIQPVLKKWESSDNRVKTVFRTARGHISAATNSGVEVSSGDYLVFVDNDDELPENALSYLAIYIDSHPKVELVYSDDARINGDGLSLGNPKFKPCWSPELLLSYCYVSHLKAIRTSLFRELGGYRIGFEGSQDHDFLLRASERDLHVGHIPQILYHRRVLPTSTASSGSAKPYSFVAGLRAVEEAFHRRGVKCRVIHPAWALQSGLGIYVPEMPDTGPTVAIVIPTRNNKETLEKLILSLRKTSYKSYKVYIIDNDSDDKETIRYLAKQPHQVIKISNPGKEFSFAYINNTAVKRLSEDFILLLNDDTQVIAPNWLSQMVGWLQLPGVGAVGARLLYPDERVQHAGIALPPGRVITAFKTLPSSQPGYLHFARVTRNCNAVTAAAMLTRREIFVKLGGFDEEHFAVAYNDVDYCLRLQEAGYRVVFCGEAELYHHESLSRGKDLDKPDEIIALKERRRGHKDPYFSPHMDRDSTTYNIKPTVVPISNGNKPIRTLVVTHNLNHEGAPKSAFELILGLYKRNIINPIIVSPREGPLRALYESAGIPTKILSEDSIITTAVRDISSYEDRIAHFCEEVNLASYDLVYANTATAFWAIDASRQMNVPSLWNIRESEHWQSYYDGYPNSIASRALKCFTVPYRVIFVARSTRSQWSPLDEMDNFEVIHNGLNLEYFDQDTRYPERDEARKSLGLQKNKLCILSLGTVCPRKGQMDLLFALDKLPAGVINRLSVYLVGAVDNEYTKSLQSLLEERPSRLRNRINIIPITGEIAVYFNAADVFCCTSRMESYPRVILEAMAKRLPIITTPVYGIREQVHENLNAFIYSPGDIDKLAGCITKMLENDELRSRMATASRTVLHSLTSYEEMLDEYENLFLAGALSSPPIKQYTPNQYAETSVVQADYFRITSEKSPNNKQTTKRYRIKQNTHAHILAKVPRLQDGQPDIPSYVRVILPLQHPRLTDVLTLSVIDDETEALYGNYDALLIQRDAIRSLESAEKVLSHCKESHIRLFYEIDDDLFGLPVEHPSSARYSKSIADIMITVAENSDAVFVSTVPLKERMSQFNENVIILPNALDENIWRTTIKPRKYSPVNKEIKILYMGTRTHEEDLALVKETMLQVKGKYGADVTFACIGGFVKAAYESMEIVNVPSWAHTYPEFAKWMASELDFDIAIAPLVQNEFNKRKSYIKYMDYGICGFAPILTNIEPYREVVTHGENGLLVENSPNSWFDGLCTLIDDRTLRNEISRNAQEDVLNRHTLEAQAEERRRIWKQILT
jgi:O-antigen biosynthesis protein